MIAIEATNEKGWRWISCIFNDAEAADKYFSQIPAELRSLQRKVQIPFPAYPFFIIEDRGFSYVDIAGVTAKIDATSPAEDEDAIHFNIYVVNRDFFCLQPGGDQMGEIYHVHVTDSSLKGKRRTGMLRSLVEIAEDI